jgi:hypothetical protein
VAAFSNSLDPSQREPAPNPHNEKGRPQAAMAILKSEKPTGPPRCPSSSRPLACQP